MTSMRRAWRRPELGPWLGLTGGVAAVLVVWVATAERSEVTLDELPDRFVRVEMPVGERAARPAGVPLAAAPSGGTSSGQDNRKGKQKLLLGLIGTTGESRGQAHNLWSDDDKGSGELDGTTVDASNGIDDLSDIGAGTGVVPSGAHAAPARHERSGEGWSDAAEDPLSTFAVDVDTASFVRSLHALRRGRILPAHQVRVEELVNAIPYDYDEPQGPSPLRVHAQMAPSVWDDDSYLLRVGLQARRVPAASRSPAHLTFLVDVSGSMASVDKLPLVKRALHDLAERLGPDDTVALVTYADGSRVILRPTPLSRADVVHDAIDHLEPGGGTAMSDGVFTAYELADQAFVAGHVNRVVLASDGNTNIGPTRHADITPMLQRYADRGITLTTLGVGSRGYRDDMMEQLANRGDGAYYFLSNEAEARRVLGVHLTGTLEVVARDVKVQLAFDPEAVRSYRLVGYDNRRVADRDFANDAVDAGEVGSGHQVSAVYEVVLRDGAEPASLGEVRLRFKPPGPDAPSREERVDLGWPVTSVGASSPDYRVAVATAGLAEVLRRRLGASELPRLAELAAGAANLERDRHAELMEAFDIATRHMLAP